HYFERALVQPALDATLGSKPLGELLREDPPPVAQEVIGPYLASARLLGQRTGELHLALSSTSEISAFAPEPFTEAYQRSLYETGRTRARRVFELLRKRLGELEPDSRALAEKVLERADVFLTSYARSWSEGRRPCGRAVMAIITLARCSTRGKIS